MRLLFAVFFGFICLQIHVFAELSSSSCSLLRTATSISTIIPEMARLAMRYYRASSSSDDQHHREKRFLFNENTSKDNSGAAKGSVLEQMVANQFKDVNYTKVALLILHNNETMAKIRQNVDGDVIIRGIMREIDYEKLGSTLWYAAEAEFDLQRFIASVINITYADIVYEEFVTKGTLPDWLIKSIHPDVNVQTVHRMFARVENFTHEFVRIMNSSKQLDDYLLNIIQQQALTPLGNIIQRIKVEKPTTLDRLTEIILDDVNKVVNVRWFIFKKNYFLSPFFYFTLETIFENHQSRNN
jgi:hypothetical protein